MPKNLNELLELLAWAALFVGAAVLYCRYTPDQLSAEADWATAVDRGEMSP